MIITTLKTQKEIKKETISFAMFDEATHCIIIRKGETQFYNWYEIYKEPYLYLFRELHEQQFVFIKNEIELYREIRANPVKYSKLSKILPKYIKVAVKKGNDSSIEILQEYSGIPLSEFSGKSKETDELDKIELMQLILVECCKSYLEAEIIHGELCPENILYEIEYGKISFLSGNSIILKSDLGEGKLFRPNVIHPYYKLFYGSKGSVASNQAILADLSAIALSIYELGFVDGTVKIGELLSKITVKDQMIEAIFSVNHIFKNIPSLETKTRLTNLFINLIKGEGLKDIQNIINNQNENLAKIFVTYKPDKKEYSTKTSDTAQVKKLKTEGKSIFLVLDTVPFIIKIATEDYVKREKVILSQIKRKSAGCFVKLINESEIYPNEIAIEYKGVDIDNKFKFISKDIILEHIPSIIAQICKNLFIANIFHADIKPKNISVDINWVPYLFDYDISQIIPDSRKITDEQDVAYLGLSPDYSSPEIAEYYLKGIENNKTMSISPFKSDLYSLARSLVLSLHKKFTVASIVKSFYNKGGKFNTINDSNYKDEIMKNIKNPGNDIKNITQFFWDYRAQFAEEVKSHEDVHLNSNPNYRQIMEFLSRLLNPDPTKRPSFENVIAECGKIGANLQSNERFVNKPYSSQAGKEWEIEYFTNRYAKPKLDTINSIVLPCVDSNEDSQFFSYTLVKSDKDLAQLTQFKKEALIFNTRTPILCRFIQLINENNIDLYVTGGIDDNYMEVPTHYLVDVNGKQLIKKRDMFCSRKEFGITTYKNSIIVAGGTGNKMDLNDMDDTTISLNTIEKYSTVDDLWLKLPNLQTGRINPCLVYHSSNVLYVIGGIHPCHIKEEIKEGDIICKTIETYDLNRGSHLKEIAFTTEIYCPLSDIIFLEKSDTNELVFVRNFTLIPPEKREDISDVIDIVGHEIYSLNLDDYSIKKESPNQEELVSYFNSYNVLRTEECSIVIPKYIYKEEDLNNKTLQIFYSKTNKITAIMSQ
jgi:hypothetical protein